MEWLNSNGERRQHPRFSVKLPLDYWESRDVLNGGLVADISESGLRIHSVHSIQTGAELRIRVYLPKEEFTFDNIEGSGKVIWKALHREGDWRGYQYGLYLTEMTLDDRERLRELLKLEQGENPSMAGRGL